MAEIEASEKQRRQSVWKRTDKAIESWVQAHGLLSFSIVGGVVIALYPIVRNIMLDQTTVYKAMQTSVNMTTAIGFWLIGSYVDWLKEKFHWKERTAWIIWAVMLMVGLVLFRLAGNVSRFG